MILSIFLLIDQSTLYPTEFFAIFIHLDFHHKPICLPLFRRNCLFSYEKRIKPPLSLFITHQPLNLLHRNFQPFKPFILTTSSNNNKKRSFFIFNYTVWFGHCFSTFISPPHTTSSTSLDSIYTHTQILTNLIPLFALALAGSNLITNTIKFTLYVKIPRALPQHCQEMQFAALALQGYCHHRRRLAVRRSDGEMQLLLQCGNGGKTSIFPGGKKNENVGTMMVVDTYHGSIGDSVRDVHGK